MKDYGTWIGLISLATASFLIIEFFLWFFHLIKSKYEESKAKKIIKNNINNLDIHEKDFLREFYIQEKNTIHLPIENPVVAGLIYKNVITIVGEISISSSIGPLLSVSISQDYLKYLKAKNLGFSTDAPTKEELELMQMLEKRPEGMEQIAPSGIYIR